MGALPSTPRDGVARPQETAEYLIGEFVGDKSFPLTSDYWQKLLELPLDLRWPSHRVRRACQLFGPYILDLVLSSSIVLTCLRFSSEFSCSCAILRRFRLLH